MRRRGRGGVHRWLCRPRFRGRVRGRFGEVRGRARGRFGERGSGVLSTTFGVTVFVALLMFAAHVLLNLWVISSVDAVAFDAATDVATSGTSGAARAAAEDQALARAREALGGYRDEVELRFVDAGAGSTAVLVDAPGLHLLPFRASRSLGLDGLHRRIVVVDEVVAR